MEFTDIRIFDVKNEEYNQVIQKIDSYKMTYFNVLN